MATNDGIGRYYGLVKEAGRRIPPHLMENNFRWRFHMQKAELDMYNQLKLQRELFKEERVCNTLKSGLESGNIDEAIGKALVILDEPAETPRMARHREEAGRLGDETQDLFNVRNIGYFKLSKKFRDIQGGKDFLEKASVAQSVEEKKRLIKLAIEAAEMPVKARDW